MSLDVNWFKMSPALGFPSKVPGSTIDGFTGTVGCCWLVGGFWLVGTVFGLLSP